MYATSGTSWLLFGTSSSGGKSGEFMVKKGKRQNDKKEKRKDVERKRGNIKGRDKEREYKREMRERMRRER